ncbi:MAG: hypothetical protein NC433_14595 [Clostridiales bacterium]|nr:hypothetical protein [Clostridiales bacterium]
MKLNERVAIISEENINRLSRLYGEINIDDLSRIVNNHLKVAIDEIEEDCSKHRTQNCAECKYMRMYDYGNKVYYCDHENRIDDMGKLGEDNLPETSPEWCPLKK